MIARTCPTFPFFYTNLSPKFIAMVKLLRKDVEFELQNDHFESFDTIKSDLLPATQTALRLAKPRQQYVALCVASYFGSGFVLMIEEFLVEKRREKKT